MEQSTTTSFAPSRWHHKRHHAQVSDKSFIGIGWTVLDNTISSIKRLTFLTPGDSGSPLVSIDSTTKVHTLMGAVSFGNAEGCEKGEFTRQFTQKNKSNFLPYAFRLPCRLRKGDEDHQPDLLLCGHRTQNLNAPFRSTKQLHQIFHKPMYLHQILTTTTP